MSSTTSSIAEEIENGIAELIQTVTQSEASSADRMERHIWWGLLAIGRQLMQLFFEVHNQRKNQYEQSSMRVRRTAIGGNAIGSTCRCLGR